jgi:hypothetical protein
MYRCIEKNMMAEESYLLMIYSGDGARLANPLLMS